MHTPSAGADLQLHIDVLPVVKGLSRNLSPEINRKRLNLKCS